MLRDLQDMPLDADEALELVAARELLQTEIYNELVSQAGEQLLTTRKTAAQARRDDRRKRARAEQDRSWSAVADQVTAEAAQKRMRNDYESLFSR